VEQKKRLDGLDLARFWALIGMVMVNFKLEVVADRGPESLLAFAKLLEGRSTSLFVTLAGLGVALMVKSGDLHVKRFSLQKRAIFLFFFGTFASTAYSGDILHFYGVYLLIASFFLRLPANWYKVLMFISAVAFVPMFLTWDYNAGWDWDALKYTDYLSFEGYFRNLFFNGFFPVLPWMTYIFFGLWLGTQELHKRSFHYYLMGAGSLLMVTAIVIREVAVDYFIKAGLDETIASEFFNINPMPPMPLYILAGTAFAMISIGACLYLASIERFSKVVRVLANTGQYSFSLYMIHIVFFIFPLDKWGDELGLYDIRAPLGIALVFMVLSIVVTHYWTKKFQRGPVEKMMRIIAG
jgi:uncharacterized protein